MINYQKLTQSELSILVKSVFILAQIPDCPLSEEEKTALNDIKGELWVEMAKRGIDES